MTKEAISEACDVRSARNLDGLLTSHYTGINSLRSLFYTFGFFIRLMLIYNYTNVNPLGKLNYWETTLESRCLGQSPTGGHSR